MGRGGRVLCVQGWGVEHAKLRFAKGNCSAVRTIAFENTINRISHLVDNPRRQMAGGWRFRAVLDENGIGGGEK